MDKDTSNDPLYVAATGRRLLQRPKKDIVKKVFNGSIEAYRLCVIANFPGCQDDLNGHNHKDAA
jgi:hypothetical protein